MRLIGDIARLNARRFGNKPAILFEDRILTFEQLHACAQGIAALLHDKGIRAGDRVAILAENCLEFLPVYFGIVGLGAIAVPLNFRCTRSELDHMITDSDCRILFHSPDFAEMAQGLADSMNELQPLLAMTRELLDLTGTPPRVTICENDPAVIMYTSGTTGQPKGVVLPHRSLIEQAAGTALAAGIRSGDRILVTVPLFHGSGLYVTGHSHLYMGASLVLAKRFVAEDQLTLIRDLDVTTFFGVPTQYAMLLDAEAKEEGNPAALKNAWYGGAQMPPEVLARMEKRWPDVRFCQLYGQTETTITTVLPAEEHHAKCGTVGRELPNCEMRVVDDNDEECPLGTVGEVIVHRLAGMTGYFNNPAQTSDTIRKDWIYTGDLGFLDGDRYLTLVDRKRDMIISGGENIYPAEIEHVLLKHEGIRDVAIVGAPDAKWGQSVVAFIVLRPGAQVTARALEAWCSDRLARYKMPRTWRFIDTLPRTANGKIRKPELRAMLDCEPETTG